MRALVIEDDEIIAKLNSRLLQREGFRTDTTGTAEEGGRLAATDDYDFILLDLFLPDANGIDVLLHIRGRGMTTPVLVVSGAGDIDATVGALDAGADDYLHKPYRSEELGARVRALMRRSQNSGPPTLICGNLTLNRIEREAAVSDQKLILTAREFVLLEYFAMKNGETLTREQLLLNVWRINFDPGTNMVDASVSRLRTKLTSVGASCTLQSERGIGYIFRKA